jgi:hypothetical protein
MRRTLHLSTTMYNCVPWKLYIQKLVDLTYTWSYWNKLSCQKPVFLGQGWCNSSISFCLDANWMSFELTLNRIVPPIYSTTHLNRLHSIDVSSANFPEGLLILYRSGIFSVDRAAKSLSICPWHRDFFGIYWRDNSIKCQFKGHPESPSGKFALDTSILCRRLRWVVVSFVQLSIWSTLLFV